MKSWTILEILNWIKEFFREKQIENPRLNAEIIVSHVLDLKRLDLYLKFDQIVTPEERELIKQMIIRRSKNEPLQYILGETEFYDCRIKVNKSVLIPRPETELLVEKVIEHSSGVTNILDIGTGSGCIAIALAKELGNVQIDAVDISSEALQTARENAELNGAEVKFFQSDVFSRVTKKYDIIVSNPPYISPAEFTGLPSEVKDFEPGNALLSEENGLYFYRKILNEVEKHLTDNGKIYFEIGHDQAEEISIIALERGFSKITVFQDLNGFDRIMRIEKKLAAKTV